MIYPVARHGYRSGSVSVKTIDPKGFADLELYLPGSASTNPGSGSEKATDQGILANLQLDLE